MKKVFLEISQNSQENTCARASFLIKLQALPETLLKKRLWRRCFPVNFAKFLRTPCFTEHLWWLLLKIQLWIRCFSSSFDCILSFISLDHYRNYLFSLELDAILIAQITFFWEKPSSGFGWWWTTWRPTLLVNIFWK